MIIAQPCHWCNLALGSQSLSEYNRYATPPFITREESLRRLRAVVASAQPIIGAGAGTGISARFAERGGVDLIIIYNSGRCRMAGRGSLAGLPAYGDANAIVVEMVHEVLPVVQHTPVLAGVNGTDPFRLMPVFLRELHALGFGGVFRANLEEAGMSYSLEVDMIGEAHRLGMLTCPYVFDSLEHTEGIVGFFGASSIERLAVEPAIEGQARAFKALSLPG